MDRFNFINPARIKVALVPIGSILPSDYDHYSRAIAAISNVRLLDITPMPECRYFNPQEFSQGRLLYDIDQYHSEESSSYLHEFEPFRKTYIVLGVAVHLSYTPSIDTIKHLESKFPSAIVRNLICFKSSSKSDTLGIFHVSKEAESNISTIETIMCRISQTFLLALDSYAASFENITIRSPISMTNSNMLARTITQAQKALSSSSSYKVSFANGQGSQPKDLKFKSSQRQTGRQAKVMGNFYLLAGRSQDALQYFTDAAINAKKADDFLWLASSLDGLSVAILMLLYLNLPYQIPNSMLWPLLQIPKNKSFGRSIPKTSSESKTPSTSSPRTSVSSNRSFASFSSATTDFALLLLVDTLLFLTLRSSYFYQLSTSDAEDCVPDMVYVESLLRNIKFMVTVYISGSSNMKLILTSMVDMEPAERSRDSDSSSLPRADILQEIDKIFALQLVLLEFSEQCHIYCALASIYNDLGYYRKQGFILRILLVALQPKLLTIGDRGSNEGFSLQSISDIVEVLFSIYHMDIDTETLSSSASNHYTNSMTLQLLLLKICLRIAESLQDYSLLAKLCILAFARFSHCLPNEDQIKLKEKLDWLTLLLQNESYLEQLPHPDPFIIRDMKFVVPQGTSNSAQLFSLEEKAGSSQEGSAVFFNPYKQSASKTANLERVICLNEPNHLKFTLQNPFAFPLNLKGAEVVAEDNFKISTLQSLVKVLSFSNFENTRERSLNWRNIPKRKVLMEPATLKQSSEVEIPANSLAEILVCFRALEAGDFIIKGLNLAIGNSKPQFFYIVNGENVSAFEKLRYDDKIAPTKVAVLETMMKNLLSGNIEGRVSKKTLSLTASCPQPQMSFIENLVANGWVMLLEGEHQKHSMTLRNTSLEIVNYLSFSLWDSTIDAITAKLNWGQTQSNIGPEETYELEWALLNQKAVEVSNKSQIASECKEIQPGGDLHIELELFGKRAMTSLKLILQYANKRESDIGGRYLRSLVVPFNTSVTRSVQIVNSEIYPFSPSYLKILANGVVLSEKSLVAASEYVSQLASSNQQDVSDFCLLALDVRNFWKDTLFIQIKHSSHSEEFIAEERINPNTTSRILLPLRKFSSKEIDASKRIPSLRNRQYIKNHKLTEEEEYQAQLSFWVRSKLLDTLEATWCTTGLILERRGEVDLRRFRLSSSMVNTLTTGSILIYQSIICEKNQKDALAKRDNIYDLEREQFYILRTRLVNHTDQPLSGTFRHVPVPMNLGSKLEMPIDTNILYNGALQTHLKEGSIAPHGEFEMSLGFLVLEKGVYEWGCIFDVSNKAKERIVGRSPIIIEAY